MFFLFSNIDWTSFEYFFSMWRFYNLWFIQGVFFLLIRLDNLNYLWRIWLYLYTNLFFEHRICIFLIFFFNFWWLIFILLNFLILFKLCIVKAFNMMTSERSYRNLYLFGATTIIEINNLKRNLVDFVLNKL